MPYTRKRCRICGTESSDTIYISRAGYCLECAAQLQVERQIQLANHSGRYYDEWLAGCRAAETRDHTDANVRLDT
jgi:hypothetical protein